jgi:hypothetical protein
LPRDLRIPEALVDLRKVLFFDGTESDQAGFEWRADPPEVVAVVARLGSRSIAPATGGIAPSPTNPVV